MCDALTVGNELPANRLRVLHAGILVLLLVRHRRYGCDCDSKQTECQQHTHVHYKPPLPGVFRADFVSLTTISGRCRATLRTYSIERHALDAADSCLARRDHT